MERFSANSLEKLINELGRLPGIGPKSAQRLAYHILKSGKEDIENLSKAMAEVKEKVRYCSKCFNITESDPCNVCSSNKRNKNIICIVEEPLDIMSLEKTGSFNGVYHVLMGSISPLDGIGPEDLKIKELLRRIEPEKISEVIIATNPDVEGEATALFLSKILKPLGVKVYRLALGIPMGASLEYTDEVTLARALEGKREI
ncbi:MAG: recombination protein RecR [Candidatus Firestonebacteria bacterium RIFOXYC2_FULL_39_67]|nr:MAG: recombination protein RecR [Candidatus Firestonebacteria bacterium RIFOXYD2_FULL_39_29]OGF54325.1 MAG: recombination protein RecR [Candidatus Firestonebacteria bacterium RIFOXYC2_FULL_39_67]OGF58035.1 MAG: recombination protein RecR [Candidatus Firestonebacteria bacterium RifOxyC12_full_39_7]